MKKEIQTKEEAIESVVFGNKTDYNRIFSFAEQWVKSQFRWFSADDLKEAYYSAGNPAPVEPKVFGGVFNSLSRASFIYHFGYTKSKNKAAHGRDLKTWISKEYKERQKNNASNKNNLKLEL